MIHLFSCGLPINGKRSLCITNNQACALFHGQKVVCYRLPCGKTRQGVDAQSGKLDFCLLLFVRTIIFVFVKTITLLVYLFYDKYVLTSLLLEI